MCQIHSDDKWSRVESLLGQSLMKLNSSRVGIVGLGSLGSLAALQLAMSGVGNYILIDPEVLEPHNIVRHAADTRYIGQPKVEIMRDLILHRNEAANVVTIQDDAMNHIEALRDVDIILVAALGLESVATNFAIAIRELRKPAIFAGLYEKAIAGEVFIVHPSIGPCYSCIASKLRKPGADNPDEGMEYGLQPEELKAQPGLGAHVNRIAIVMADWTLRYLVFDQNVLPFFPGNLAILSNESYTMGTDRSGSEIKLLPSSSYWLQVKKDPDCLICGAPSSDMPFGSIDDLLNK